VQPKDVRRYENVEKNLALPLGVVRTDVIRRAFGGIRAKIQDTSALRLAVSFVFGCGGYVDFARRLCSES
jgi:hypothetical protein